LVALAEPSDQPAPQLQLRSYALHGQVDAAEISPDEKLVAVQVTRSEPGNGGSGTRFVELAQLWDFRADRMLAETVLEEVFSAKPRLRPAMRAPRTVRFSADGELVVIYLDHRLHVLKADDLREVRSIPMNGPPAMTPSESSIGMPWLTNLEISPRAHQVALVWATELEVYDLDSGRRLNQWGTKELHLGVHNPSGLAWESDGQHLAVAVPNTFACSSPDNTPDVFVVDAASGKVTLSFSTGLTVGAIAITPDSRLWAVDDNCLGAFKNHHPKMKVFDLNKGKPVKQISGRDSGIRYAVATSRDGGRVVAYTGRMRVSFDWLDMTAWGVPVDQTFSVWNGHDYQPVATSQDLGPVKDWVGRVPRLNLRLSSAGHFVLFNSAIYELPETSAIER
jgi:hypothetical protein